MMEIASSNPQGMNNSTVKKFEDGVKQILGMAFRDSEGTTAYDESQVNRRSSTSGVLPGSPKPIP